MEILSRDEEENFRIWILATAVNYKKTDMSKILTRNHNPLAHTHTHRHKPTHTSKIIYK